MAPGRRDELFKPIGGREGIGVQGGDPFALRVGTAAIVAGREAQIPVQLEDRESCVAADLRSGKGNGPVMRSVVHEDGVEIREGLRLQRGNASLQIRAGIEVDDDDGDDG